MKKNIFYFSAVLFLMLTLSSNAQNPELWGMTMSGGKYGSGVMFKTDINGNNQNVTFNFFKYEGKYPRGSLTKSSNGKLYGMTYLGRENNYGVLFEYDPATGTYTKKLDFDGSNTGSKPYGSLTESSNGKLYGMTYLGGANNYGVLFEFDPATGTYTKELDFDGSNTGSNPLGSLTGSSNGRLYGMTYSGGTNGGGVLFEFDPATGTYTKKLDFDASNTGSHPRGSLTESSNGKLYGMTYDGGTNGVGVLFEYDPATGNFTKQLDFDGSNTGSNPYGSLTESSNSSLYGMTYNGGTNGGGVLFEFDPVTGTYTKELDFDASNTGSHPRGSLTESSNGKLYGMTYDGGTNGVGVLFEYDPATETYTKELDFDGLNTGSNPYGSLTEFSNSSLYGMTYSGGTKGYGVLYEFDPATGNYTKKLDFNGSNTGNNPMGSLTEFSNGSLYGMTPIDGTNGYGVLFEYDPATSNYTKKLDFDGSNTGSSPNGSLTESLNGKLYGMTYSGGANDYGVLFEFDPATGTYTKELDFDGSNTGRYPYGSLTESSNGKLYGMTNSGGTNNFGILFEYDPATRTFTRKLDFDGTNTGSNPFGSLTKSSNGKLYGITNNGGTNNFGVLFEYDPETGTFTKKLDFDDSNTGSNPMGSLTESSNGKLYGMTHYGGTNNYGVLFEFDPATGIFTKRLDFDDLNTGSNPMGSLTESSNGKLYGMTFSGGTNHIGVLFEYDPDSDSFNKKLDFDGTNGKYPYFSSLIETNICYNTTSTIDVTVCDSYTVPSGDETYYTSGIYLDTIPNACGSDSIITVNLNLNNSQASDTIAVACDFFTWYGTDYTTSGDYTHTLQTVNGCDSVLTLHLTINTVDVSVTQDGATLTANESGAFYQWIDCSDNLLIEGAINQSYTATGNGEYAVFVDNGNCADTSVCYTVSGLAINEISAEIKIYPNPATGILNIEAENIKNVSITDISGKFILEQVVNNDKVQIDLRKFAKSVYFIKVETEKGVKSEKLIVE